MGNVRTALPTEQGVTMEYEWKANGRAYELLFRRDAGLQWEAYYPLGRLRRIKNKHSCKKFALERCEYGSWTYITLLGMKLDEAKEVARTILIAGANDD